MNFQVRVEFLCVDVVVGSAVGPHPVTSSRRSVPILARRALCGAKKWWSLAVYASGSGRFLGLLPEFLRTERSFSSSSVLYGSGATPSHARSSVKRRLVVRVPPP